MKTHNIKCFEKRLRNAFYLFGRPYTMEVNELQLLMFLKISTEDMQRCGIT